MVAHILQSLFIYGGDVLNGDGRDTPRDDKHLSEK